MERRHALPAAPPPRSARLRDDRVANAAGGAPSQVLRDHRRRTSGTRGASAAMGCGHPCAQRRVARLRGAADRAGRGVTMENMDSQIAEWRAYVAHAPALNGHDVDELEDHLRHEITELNAAGLADDEAFLVAVKRMGDMDAVSREFAREHSDRLWKQLLGPVEDASPAPSGWVEALLFAVAAIGVIELARLAAGFPGEQPTWFARNLSVFVLPFLAGYFARRRQLDARAWMLAAVPFAVAALVINVYPYD